MEDDASVCVGPSLYESRLAHLEESADVLIIVTGANGFLGQAVIRELELKNPTVNTVALVRPKRGASGAQRFKAALPTSSAEVLEPNFATDDVVPMNARYKGSVLIHSAASVRFDESPFAAIQHNVETALRSCAFAVKNGVRRFVLISTAYVEAPLGQSTSAGTQGNPTRVPTSVAEADALWSATKGHHFNTYTWSKALAESAASERLRVAGIECCIVRPSIIGPAWSTPEPGWVTSTGSPALGAAVLVGTGLIRTWHNPGRANVVPVDWVAESVARVALDPEVRSLTWAVVPTTHELSAWPTPTEQARLTSRFNADPSVQWAYAGCTLYKHQMVYKAMSWYYEDLPAMIASAVGSNASTVLKRALTVRDVVLRTYGTREWRFPHDGDCAELPHEYVHAMMAHCTDGAYKLAVEMKARSRSLVIRPGGVLGVAIDAVAYAALATVLTCLALAALKPARLSGLPLDEYEFTWTVDGVRVGGYEWGQSAAVGLVFAQAALYQLVVSAARNFRPSIETATRWRRRHNFALSAFSGLVSIVGLGFIVDSIDVDGGFMCTSVTRPWFHAYQLVWVASKAWEWLDTAFLIWFDKPVSSLHRWHHTTTMLCFLVATPLTWLSKAAAVANGSVHFIMYAHFYEPFARKWRPWITRGQLLQFAIMFYWALDPSGSCGSPPTTIANESAQYFIGAFLVASYSALFVQFYIHMGTSKVKSR